VNILKYQPSVLISAGRLGRGGIQTHLSLLCKILRQAKAEVVISATGSDWSRSEIAEIQDEGVKFLTPPNLLLNSRPVSMIHSLLTAPFHSKQRFTSLYCISTGRSHIYLRNLVSPETVSIYHEIVSTPMVESLGWRCAESLDVVIANSEKVAQGMVELCSTKPIGIIPFLTSDKPMPSPLQRPECGERELRVVYLGRIVEHKRPNQLVKEWKNITALKPLSPARLDVYGFDPGGSLLSELRQFVVDHHLSDRICLHGNYAVSQLPEILAQADVVVLPSLFEGLPLVLVEAMQRGIPIVATAAGGTKEFGKDNPDVVITELEWDAFVTGLLAMSQKLRLGQINSHRLHQWTESRYGYTVVAAKWQDALLQPQKFFHKNIYK
jgi:glycosyltransferase involved in cell wall biosynthesis